MTNLFFLSAKCVRTRDPFYPRYDLAADGAWALTYGVKELPEGQSALGASGPRFDTSKRRTGPQYKCPWCGNKDYVLCRTCHKITCYDGLSSSFFCVYCNRTGIIGDPITNDEFTGIDKRKGYGQN